MGTTKQVESEFIEIGAAAGSVTEAVQTRHSVRYYQERAVPAAELEDLFATALRAPSWKNSQPWNLHVVTGASRDRMAATLTNAAQTREPAPETPWAEDYPSATKRRMFALGMQVYGVAGIDRKDQAARDAFMLRNFEFFGAPVGVFLTTRCELNFFVGIDIGCFLQTLMLLARERGLATCPQAALGAFPDVVRGELKLADDEKVVCGMSLGYAQPDAALNRFHAPRESLDSLVTFYDS